MPPVLSALRMPLILALHVDFAAIAAAIEFHFCPAPPGHDEKPVFNERLLLMMMTISFTKRDANGRLFHLK